MNTKVTIETFKLDLDDQLGIVKLYNNRYGYLSIMLGYLDNICESVWVNTKESNKQFRYFKTL